MFSKLHNYLDIKKEPRIGRNKRLFFPLADFWASDWLPYSLPRSVSSLLNQKILFDIMRASAMWTVESTSIKGNWNGLKLYYVRAAPHNGTKTTQPNHFSIAPVLLHHNPSIHVSHYPLPSSPFVVGEIQVLIKNIVTEGLQKKPLQTWQGVECGGIGCCCCWLKCMKSPFAYL